jgi:SAM-dependent methyltransferase
LPDEIAGRRLYGDNFSVEQVEEWYADEVHGFFDLLSSHYQIVNDESQYAYEYEALNVFHAIGSLRHRRFETCLALGCAAGDDIKPLAPVVGRFIAIEPDERWQRAEIGGKPAVYLKPAVMGDLALEAASVDLATAFGVLHHIPNVTHVVAEIARVVRPGGLFVVREPISSMGDWRRPRVGLTAHERGLPLKWFEGMARSNHFRLVSRRACMFNPLTELAKKIGLATPLAIKPIVVLDWWLSEALRWNAQYWRDSLWKKLAPSSAFWTFERVPG